MFAHNEEREFATVVEALPKSSKDRFSTSDASSEMSVIGKDLTIIGEKLTIISQSRLQVDGVVHGDLHSVEVVIGEGGHVSGTVAAENVVVRGGVEGAIRGERVELQSTARVEGDIHHKSLSIDQGAIFDGRSRRPEDLSELKPVLDPAGFDDHAG